MYYYINRLCFKPYIIVFVLRCKYTHFFVFVVFFCGKMCDDWLSGRGLGGCGVGEWWSRVP